MFFKKKREYQSEAVMDTTKPDVEHEAQMARFYAAQKKFREVGCLGVTKEDHFDLSGTPPDKRLEDNPGKTLGELCTDQELKERLDDYQELIRRLCADLEKEPDNIRSKEFLGRVQQEFKLAIDYLSSINRLPKEYSGY